MKRFNNKDMVKPNFNEAEKLFLDKPKSFYYGKISVSIGVDRKLTMREIYFMCLSYRNIPNRRECIEQEFDNLDKELK